MSTATRRIDVTAADIRNGQRTSEAVDDTLADARNDVYIDEAQYAAMEREVADVRATAADLMGVDGVIMYGDIVDSEDMGAEARQVATEMGWPVEEQERERA